MFLTKEKIMLDVKIIGKVENAEQTLVLMRCGNSIYSLEDLDGAFELSRLIREDDSYSFRSLLSLCVDGIDVAFALARDFIVELEQAALAKGASLPNSVR